MNPGNDVKNLEQLRTKAATTIANVRTEFGNAAADVKETASVVSDNVANDIQDLLQSARQSGKAELMAAADRVGRYVDSIAESTNALGRRGRETAQAALKTTDTYVKDNPWQSVAIGTGIGALLGIVLYSLASRR